jgi:hypothetical protein
MGNILYNTNVNKAFDIKCNLSCSPFELYAHTHTQRRSNVQNVNVRRWLSSRCWWLWWSRRWGQTMSLNCSHQRAHCSTPRWYIWAWRTMVEWYRQGKTPHSSTRALWQSYQQSPGSKQKKQAKWMMNSALRSIFVQTCKWSFTCSKALRHGTSRPKKGVLRTCIALTNPSPRPCLNPRTMGVMANTLTITSPRQLLYVTRCSFVETGRRFRGAYCFHTQRDHSYEFDLIGWQPVTLDSLKWDKQTNIT